MSQQWREKRKKEKSKEKRTNTGEAASVSANSVAQHHKWPPTMGSNGESNKTQVKVKSDNNRDDITVRTEKVTKNELPTNNTTLHSS